MGEPTGLCREPDCGACERRRTVCYMCSSECGVTVHVRGGDVVGVFGDPLHPSSHGALCPKALHAPELAHGPDRIRAPLRRVGARGEGRFEEVSWEVALDGIARRLVDLKRREGPQTLLVQFGEKPDHDLVYRFARSYGTPNVLDHDSICDANRRTGFMYTYGLSHHRPLPDLGRPLLTSEGERRHQDCRYLLLIGENPLEATRFLYLRDGIRQAVRQGMHLAVADPFRSGTAALAHEWLPVRPGSDLALVLGLLRFVVEHDDASRPERRYLDHEFIRRHASGFDELRSWLLASRDELTPRWVADRTGLDAATIERVAHGFGSTKPAAAMVGMNGVGHHTNGFQTARALAMLVAITGNLDVPGGLALAPLPKLDLEEVQGERLLARGRREMHKDLFAGFPLACRGVKAKVPQDILEGVRLTHGAHAGESYRIRSLFIIHGNPLINAPGSTGWHEALTRRDARGEHLVPLVVFNDTRLNDSGLYADYVLPMASFLERQGICRIYLNQPTVSLRDPVIPPQHQSRTPLGWLKPLAEACARLGDSEMVSAIPYASDDEWCDALLRRCPGLPWHDDGIAPDGQALTSRWLRAHGGTATWPARYRKYADGMLDTPSGKVELRSEIIEEANRRFGTAYEPLLRHEENRWNPRHPDHAAHGERFPFQLVTGRSYHHSGSATQDLPGALALQPEPAVAMNPSDARRLGLGESDRVLLRNPLGAEVRARLGLSENVRQGVVRATHGWGQRSPFLSHARDRGYNVNVLTDAANFDSVSGNAGLGDMLVAVLPAP